MSIVNIRSNSSMSKFYETYEGIHKIVQRNAAKIQEEFRPDIIVAIGGGGFIPARMLRGYLRIPMMAIIVKLYDDEIDGEDIITKEPERFQWLDNRCLEEIKGKRILLVDEVDDSRKTLEYCASEMVKHDISQLGIFVVHNKRKPKLGVIPKNVYYMAGDYIDDKWIIYPWEAVDIDEHEMMAHGQ